MKYSLPEIRTWLKIWLLDYRRSEYNKDQHLAMVADAAQKVDRYIDSPNEIIRMTARSIGQYLAQSKLRPKKSIIITEIIAYILLPFGLMRWLFKGIIYKPQQNSKVAGVRWGMDQFRYQITPEMFHTPQELASDQPQAVFVPARYLRLNDLVFICKIISVAWSILPAFKVQWIFKVAKEIAFARPLIDTYPSDYALIDAEFSCGLSILTLYAHRHGQKIYNVQHGDIFLWSTNSFFEADRCYCWDDFYINVLKQLRARSDFRVYANPTFLLSDEEKAISRQGVGVFMPVLLSIPSELEQQQFITSINTLAETYTVHLRPHPAHMHECDSIRSLLSPKIHITDPRSETSKHFILRHELLIGTISATVIESIMLGAQMVCFRGTYVNDIASYHFAYQKPNCHLCELPALAETALKTIEENYSSRSL